MGAEKYTACCGLYCGDCIPANQSLHDAAERLKQALESTQFEEYAKFKSAGNKIFDSFGVFQEVLEAILALRCVKTCPDGGGRPNCPIRNCASQQRLEGCWQCTAFEACELLEPLSACHGDTHRHNLRMVKQHGVVNWACKRGQHYLWQKPGERGAD